LYDLFWIFYLPFTVNEDVHLPKSQFCVVRVFNHRTDNMRVVGEVIPY